MCDHGVPHPLRSSCAVACRDIHLVTDVGRHRRPGWREPAQHHVAALVRSARLQPGGGVQEHCRGELIRWAELGPPPPGPAPPCQRTYPRR
jgi:hypothetical protein